MVPAKNVREILDRASKAGVRVLDTAAEYGSSEQVLGNNLTANDRFRIVTKTQPVKAPKITSEHVQEFQNTFLRSLELLKMDHVYGLLVHHASDVCKPGGELLIDALENEKAAGRAEKIGVSVYGAPDIEGILERFVPDIVQLPINLADQRLIKSGHLKELKRRGAEIHARSVFLQGLLLTNPEKMPDYFEPVRGKFAKINRRIEEQGSSRLQACLGFALEVKELDTILVGVTTNQELSQIIDGAENFGGRSFDCSDLAIEDERFVDPSQWVLDD